MEDGEEEKEYKYENADEEDEVEEEKEENDPFTHTLCSMLKPAPSFSPRRANFCIPGE